MKNAIIRYWLQKIALWLTDNKAEAIGKIQAGIAKADAQFAKGPEKLEYVRKIAVPYLASKSGWVIDGVIHLLLIVARKS